MSDKTIIFFLVLTIIMLLLIIMYQRFVFTRGIQTKLKQISEKLEEILETGSDEKVMVFTDNKVLILRLGNADNEMLKKVESKAKQVMDLINQFFTLAKLEAGDTNINLCKININELCRENVLSFYDILLQKDFTVDISIPETTIFVQGDKDALQRILFNLISNVIRREIQGNGLGLTIAKNLAVQLDGDIFLDSIPNIKTTFTVKLKKISY